MTQPAEKQAPESPLAEIRAFVENNQVAEAEAAFIDFVERKFDIKVKRLKMHEADSVSLNSIRAEIDTEDGQELFAKAHLEKGEATRMGKGEYYRADILEKAGFPIDKPVYRSTEVGEQMVIYPRVNFAIFHDACRDLEAAGCPADQVETFAAAYDAFQKILGERYVATLHEATREQNIDETYHTLIYRRLVDQDGDTGFGGRHKEFYQGKMIPLPGDQQISFEDLCDLKWVINGIPYQFSLGESFERARDFTNPARADKYAAVTAHGDDHTANLWWIPEAAAGEQLRYYDPAFAGEHISALQAAVKAFFHVNFAHPNWLYDPDESDAKVSVEIKDGEIHVTHDWDLTDLRARFVQSQLDHVWKPLVKAIKAQGLLPDEWEEIVRSTLFCCPILCKNLVAGLGSPNPLNPEASALGFAISVMLASPPESGQDRISTFINELKAEL